MSYRFVANGMLGLIAGVIGETYGQRPSQVLREIESRGLYDALFDVAVLTRIRTLTEHDGSMGSEIQREYRRLARLGR